MTPLHTKNLRKILSDWATGSHDYSALWKGMQKFLVNHSVISAYHRNLLG